ncbi:MAG TPA: plastocyanin/azurin family copper-binding protein [Longimicrobiales bacterium]|nr:plastocyanin/azurin family copper-binding protein [Longimicrobiales bacterium]
MKAVTWNAPARRLACAGVFLFSVTILACDRKATNAKSDDRTLELSGDTIELPSGVRLHDIVLHAVSGSDFDPATSQAKVGDVVRFTSGDTHTHALVVTPPSEQARQALNAGGQLRSPPLVSKGQAWVISFKGAPAGTYTVSCISHQGAASIVVQ